MSVRTRIREVLKAPYEALSGHVRGVRAVERANGRFLIGDAMGCGKTFQAICYAAINPDAFPVICVVPGNVKYNWQKEFKKFVGMDSQVLEAHKGYGLIFEDAKGKKKTKGFTSTEKRLNFIRKNIRIKVLEKTRIPHPPINSRIVILNYDILQDWKKELLALDPQMLIIDECQYIKERTAIRTRICQKLARKCKYFLPLSGTPITNRPIEFFPVLNMLAPLDFYSYIDFAYEYCNPKKSKWGGKLDFTGAANLEELHQRAKPHMIRRLLPEMVKGLKPKYRHIREVEITNRREYNKARDHFLHWLEHEEGKNKADKASRAETLVKIGKLKLLTAQGKLKAAIAWIDRYTSKPGRKLVVFGVHRSIIAKLHKHYAGSVIINGGISAKKVQAAVDSFQEDPDTQLLFGNIKAAGVGITLTAACTALMLELGWSPADMDQCEDRIYRIGQTKNVNIYYLLGLNTIDQRIWDLLKKKRNICSTILDGRTEARQYITEKLFKGAA